MLPFVHIPRTGGTTITVALRNALRGATPPENLHESVRTRQLKNEWTDSDLTFTLIRNPFDRLVSWFFWHKQQSSFDTWAKSGFKLAGVYETWFPGGGNPLNQEEFFLDNDGQCAVRHVFKYEQLTESAKSIGKLYGVTLKLSDKYHVSVHEPYQNYYTEETIKIVKEKFGDFMNQWNYDFDERSS
jgi:sulfotransferase famil protein